MTTLAIVGGLVLVAVLVLLAFLVQSLHTSEKRFRLLAENASDLVCLHDEFGRYIWVSPSVKHLLGYTPRELFGRHPKDFLHPEDQEMCQALVSDCGGPEEAFRLDCRFQHKDGHYVWVETVAESARSKDGDLLQIRSASRDVTKQKRAESLYRFLVENLPKTSVFLFDQNMTHIVAEGPLVASLGLDPVMNTNGLTLWATFPADIVRKLQPYYEQALNGERNVVDEVLLGHQHTIHLMPVNGGGQLAMAVFRDVSEERLTLEVLKDRTHDLERSNRDLEQFANVASHELKAPLRRISSFAELLAIEYPGTLSNETSSYIQHIVDGVQALHEVIEALLTYSRVQTDRSAMQWVDMNTVFAEAVQNLGPMIAERGAKVEAGGLPVSVVGDPVLLRQLLENLICNGIKFNTTGRVPEVHVSAYRGLMDWEIFVEDNGPGINPEYRKKVFTMFSRLRPDVEGSGIGLALCKKIVGIHRGVISFASSEDRGTTFQFTLPSREPGENIAVSSGEIPAIISGETYYAFEE